MVKKEIFQRVRVKNLPATEAIYNFQSLMCVYVATYGPFQNSKWGPSKHTALYLFLPTYEAFLRA